MCKFCDSNKERNVMSYDNHNSMDVYCGQYQGVYVASDLKMKGNVLTLSGHGSYRSRFDCYYENEGLDCDDEAAAEKSPAKYIKIEYCPFCGKKLDSTEFERKETKKTIASLTNKLKATKEKNTLYVNFTFVAKGEMYKKAEKMVWKRNGNDRDVTLIPLTLETIIKEFGNLKCHLTHSNNSYFEPFPFNPKDGVTFTMVRFNEFQGHPYIITEEQYDMLAEMGLVKKDKTKAAKMREKRIKAQEEIQKMENKLAELKAYLKTL